MHRAIDEPGIRLAPAAEADIPLILAFIRELAEYERLAAEGVVTEALLRESLFGPRPAAEILIARAGGEPAGFAVYFPSFSTFLGRAGLYLEDLYVRPAWRGRGIGRALLTELARIARARGSGRLEWSVLDWNAPAIAFYRRLGASPMSDWTVFRLSGTALDRLAGE